MLTIKSGKKAVPIPETEKELKRIGKLWIQRARYKLDNAKPFEAQGTGKLRASMKTKVFVERNQPNVDITPAVTYWEFVDMGVQGSKSSPFPLQKKSPFKFTSKMPPREPILKWVKTRGLQFRDANGRYVTHNTTAYLIQRSIYFRGLKPRRFISDTGQALMDKYFDRVVSAYMRDLENATKTDT